MNDIAHASKMFDFIIYADYTALSTTIEIVIRTTMDLTTSDILNNELSMVNNLKKVNKLSLNIKRSIYMICNTEKIKVQSSILKIDNVNIE